MSDQVTFSLVHLLQLLLVSMRVDRIARVAERYLAMNALTAIAVVYKLLFHRIVLVLELIIVIHFQSTMVQIFKLLNDSHIDI